MATAIKPFALVGSTDLLLIEVMQAINAFTPAECFVIAPKRIPFIGFPTLARNCFPARFDGSDDEHVIFEINRLAEEKPGLVVIPCDCPGARLTDRIRCRLRAAVIPAPNASMLDCFDDKWRFYQFCKQHGLNVPDSRLIGSKHDLNFRKVAQELGCPFVLKPLYELASVGIRMISSEDQYFREIRDNDAYQYTPLMAQRYVGGTDVCLNFLSLHGRVVAISILQKEHPQHPGASVKFISSKHLESVAHTIAAKGSYHGVMNIDARIEDGTGEIYLFESNPRFWRGLSASTWCGLNFVAECMPPLSSNGEIRRLTSGSADTFYHPVIRPAFFMHALFSPVIHQRRLARAMIGNVWTLSIQIRGLGNKIKRILTGKPWRAVDSI